MTDDECRYSRNGWLMTICGNRLLTVLLTLSTLGSCASLEGSGSRKTPAVVRYCEIMSIPEDEQMSLLAIYRSGFEESVLVDRSGCLLGFSFWVDFSKDCCRSSNSTAERLLAARGYGNELLLQLRGSYQCFRSGYSSGFYGHEDSYPCLFTVTAIEHVYGRVTTTKEAARSIHEVIH